MKLFEKKDSVINIEEDDLQDAKLSTIDFVDKTTRKRAFLNILGARLAMKMLFSQKIEATNLYSLYTIHNVLEELDIADIYFNGIKIDVRMVFDKEEIFIPKSHFELDLLPDLYLIFDLAQDFSGVECLGFFEPKTLNTQNQNKDFYFYEFDRLQDPKALKMFLHDFKGDGSFKPPVNLENAETLFVSLVDNEISQKDKIALFQCLANDIGLREKIVEFENFETLSKEVAKDTSLMQDGILDIVGAQQIHENEELTFLEEKAEVIGEVLTDLLDGEDETITGVEDKKEFDKNDLESILSEMEAEEENKDNDNNLAAFATGAAAGAVIGGAIAAGTTAAAAASAGLENNLIDALPDLDLDLDLDFGNNTQDLPPLIDETSNELTPSFADATEYETIDAKEDLLNELSKLEGLEETEEDEIEDDAAIQAKFFGNLDNEEIGIEELEIEEINSEPQIKYDKEETENEEFEIESISENNSTLQPFTTSTEEDLDDNDLNMINDSGVYNDEASDYQEQSPEENVVSFDEIESDEIVIPKNYDRVFNGGDDETLERLRQLEQEEDFPNQNEENQDEVISQVDEFLKEADLSGNSIGFPPDGIDIDTLDDSSLLNPVDKEETNYSYEPDVQNYTQEAEMPHPNVETNMDNEQIKLLFNEEKAEKIPDLNLQTSDTATEINPKPSGLKDKKVLIAASVASIVLISFLITQSGTQNKDVSAVPPTNAPIAAQGQAPTQMDTSNIDTAAGNSQMADQQSEDTGGDPLLQPAPPAQGNPQANVNRDMNKAVSDAFLSEPVSASISKVAWEVPEDLAYNDGFRKYLQMAGKNLKLNLQNNLLLATEMAYSNKVVVDLTINKDGSVASSNITKSSGSKQIDKIVLQSVKETLTYLKIPASEVSGNSVDATLIINF